MLAEARAQYFTRPQLLLAPGIAITLTIGVAFGLAHRLDHHSDRGLRDDETSPTRRRMLEPLIRG